MPEHRVLADEHISKTTVSKLNSHGINTVHVTEQNLRGSPDTELAEYASREKRIILTRDDDFKQIAREKQIGALYFTKRLPKKQTTAEIMKVLNKIPMKQLQKELIHLPWK